MYGDSSTFDTVSNKSFFLDISYYLGMMWFSVLLILGASTRRHITALLFVTLFFVLLIVVLWLSPRTFFGLIASFFS